MVRPRSPGRAVALRAQLGGTSSDFSAMRTPAIVVVGDEDKSELLSTAGPEWLMDSYRLAPGPRSLLTLFGAGHILGGVSGYDAAETTEENPARVEAIATMTAAYLTTQFGIDPHAWDAAQQALADSPVPVPSSRRPGRCSPSPRSCPRCAWPWNATTWAHLTG